MGSVCLIVHTVKPLHIYKKMREDGFYSGNEKYVWPEFKSSYAWMMEQMKERLPHYDGLTYPVWLWHKRPDQNRPGMLLKGQKGVIITLDIPDEDILWSCFDSWHYVLNKWLLTQTEEEYTQLEDCFSEEEMISSWSYIFDFDWLKSSEEDWLGFDPEWIQGVTPRIEMKNVMKVNRFIAK